MKKAVGKLGLARLEVFLVFGNEKEIFIKGRVVEAYKQSKPSPRKNPVQNLFAALRRYAGSSISDVKVIGYFQGTRFEMLSDEEGIFEEHIHAERKGPIEEDLLTLQIEEEEGITPERKKVIVEVLRYGSEHPIGTISDIDDTVLISHATKVGKKFWLSISKNAYTRRPFPGVSEFYRFLTAEGAHPIFYVSSSDWNLFDLIQDFLRYRHIPKGPILLKDLHINLKNIWKSGGGDHSHKMEKIDLLMMLYSKMQFILVGDSGQHDPELYAKVIEKYPGRVKAVYIREIRPTEEERRRILEKFENKVEIAWVANTEEAINHARQNIAV